MRKILLLILILNCCFDAFAQESQLVQNIYQRKDEANKRIEVHYTLTEDVFDIQLKIKKKSSNNYIINPNLSGDINKNIQKGDRVVYWIPTQEEGSDDYIFDFTPVFFDKVKYDNCYKILTKQLDDCRVQFNAEKSKFDKKKLQKSLIWVGAGTITAISGWLIYSSLVKQSNSFIDFQKVYDTNGDGIIDDNANQTVYNDARANIEQKRKSLPYSNALMILGGTAFTIGVGKYIFPKFKGVKCTISPNCQGSQTITITKKF